MPLSNIKMTFYDIKRCGYYNSDDYSNPAFADTAQVLTDLFNWISTSNPTIRETQTFSPPDESEFLPSFCYNIRRNNHGDFFLTLWNETPTTSGNFASINSNAHVGNVSVDTIPVPQDGIPGHPTMFWFIPSQNKVCAVLYHNNTLGIRNLTKYIQGYLERFSKWTVIQSQQNRLDTRILGYRAHETHPPSTDYEPLFAIGLLKKNGDISKIRNNRGQIKSIVKRDVYQVETRQNLGVFKRLLKHIGIVEPEGLEIEEASFKYEMEYHPTRQDLDAIINKYNEIEEPTKWDDVGFKVKGEQNTLWLGSSLVKIYRAFDFEYVDGTNIYDQIIFEKLSDTNTRLGIIREIENV